MAVTFIAWRWSERDHARAHQARLNHASIVYGSIAYLALSAALLAIGAG